MALVPEAKDKPTSAEGFLLLVIIILEQTDSSGRVGKEEK